MCQAQPSTHQTQYHTGIAPGRRVSENMRSNRDRSIASLKVNGHTGTRRRRWSREIRRGDSTSVECVISMIPLPAPRLISSTRPQPWGCLGPLPPNVPARASHPRDVDADLPTATSQSPTFPRSRVNENRHANRCRKTTCDLHAQGVNAHTDDGGE